MAVPSSKRRLNTTYKLFYTLLKKIQLPATDQRQSHPAALFRHFTCNVLDQNKN